MYYIEFSNIGVNVINFSEILVLLTFSCLDFLNHSYSKTQDSVAIAKVRLENGWISKQMI